MRAQQARHAVLARPKEAAALARAGFDAISMAGNHVLAWGRDAFFETRANLERAGIAAVGVGANIAEARRPARLTLGDGTTVAILTYSTEPTLMEQIVKRFLSLALILGAAAGSSAGGRGSDYRSCDLAGQHAVKARTDGSVGDAG